MSSCDMCGECPAELTHSGVIGYRHLVMNLCEDCKHTLENAEAMVLSFIGLAIEKEKGGRAYNTDLHPTTEL